jgi:hypothetical protein
MKFRSDSRTRYTGVSVDEQLEMIPEWNIKVRRSRCQLYFIVCGSTLRNSNHVTDAFALGDLERPRRGEEHIQTDRHDATQHPPYILLPTTFPLYASRYSPG